MSLNEWETEGAEGLVLINVANGRHERADDHFGVVLEEVDLKGRD